jgi:hypothetical protein
MSKILTNDEIKTMLGKVFSKYPGYKDIYFIVDDETIIDIISDVLCTNYNRSMLFSQTEKDTVTTFINKYGIHHVLYVFNKPGDRGLMLFATPNIDEFIRFFKHSQFSISIREKSHLLKESMLKSKRRYEEYLNTGKMPKQMGPVNIRYI